MGGALAGVGVGGCGGDGVDYVEKQVIVLTRLLEIEDCVCLHKSDYMFKCMCALVCIPDSFACVFAKNYLSLLETRFHADMLSDTYKCVCPV